MSTVYLEFPIVMQPVVSEVVFEEMIPVFTRGLDQVVETDEVADGTAWRSTSGEWKISMNLPVRLGISSNEGLVCTATPYAVAGSGDSPETDRWKVNHVTLQYL